MVSCGADNTASRIAFSTSGNQIIDYTPQQYQLPFSLQVTNTEGVAVAGQKVTLKVVPVQYYKGIYVVGTDTWDTFDPTIVAPATVPTLPPFICPVEDANHNGILEAGEDINSNGHLDPTNPATIGPHPDAEPTLVNSNELITDQWGNGYFSLIYPKGEANWVQVQITATTSVTGTESSQILIYNLPASVADMQSIDTLPPSGSIPGAHGQMPNCSDPN